MEKGVVSKTPRLCVRRLVRLPTGSGTRKEKEGKALLARSMNYKNVFHPEKKFVMRRDSLGNWGSGFQMFSNKGFIEGNSWQYSWYVPHDIPRTGRLPGERPLQQPAGRGIYQIGKA